MKKDIIAIDTETTGVDLFHGCLPFAVSMCDLDGRTYWWEWSVNPINRVPLIPIKDLKEIKQVIKSYKRLVFYNAGFDLRGLSLIDALPVALRMPQPFPSLANLCSREKDKESFWKRVEDTQLMSHVLDSGEPHGLKPLSKKYLDISQDDLDSLKLEVKRCQKSVKASDRIHIWKLGSKVEEDYWLPKALDPESTVLKDYGLNDAIRTIQLYKLFSRELESDPGFSKSYMLEKKLLPIVFNMVERGMSLKPTILKWMCHDYVSKSEEIEQGIIETAKRVGLPDFNVRSPKQVGKLLYEKLGYLVISRTSTGEPSTDVDTLNDISAKLLKKSSSSKKLLHSILRYRTYRKAADYLEEYQTRSVKSGLRGLRLHASFNQTGTRTTRFSCSRPNLENVGKKKETNLRAAFGPTKNTIWYSVDYNQLELRIIAVAAQEEKMLEAYENNIDIHQQTADLCGTLRDPAKNANYAAIYGGGKKLLASMTGISNMHELFYEAYPKIQDYARKIISQVERTGYVETLFGYRLYVEVKKAYAGIDYVIQGTAGGIVKRAMISVDDWLKNTDRMLGTKGEEIECHLINNVHDELIFEVCSPESNKRPDSDRWLPDMLKSLMEKPSKEIGVYTPVDVSKITVGWNQLTKIEAGKENVCRTKNQPVSLRN